MISKNHSRLRPRLIMSLKALALSSLAAAAAVTMLSSTPGQSVVQVVKTIASGAYPAKTAPSSASDKSTAASTFTPPESWIDQVCDQAHCTHAQSAPASPMPTPVSKREENCVTLGRIPKHSSNIKTQDLKSYSEPNEQIKEIYIQWAEEAALVTDDSLEVMIKKVMLDFPIVDRPARRIATTPAIWAFQLKRETSLRDVAELTDRALENDIAPFDPDAESGKQNMQAKCQYHSIGPVRNGQVYHRSEDEFDYFRVNTYGKIYPFWGFSENELNGYSANQNDINISIPSSRTNELAKSRPKTTSADAIGMHRDYELYTPQSPGSRWGRQVKVAVVDGEHAFRHPRGPRFDIVKSDPPSEDENKTYKGLRKISHSMAVASKIAMAPDPQYQGEQAHPVSTMPPKAIRNLSLHIYAKRKAETGYNLGVVGRHPLPEVIWWLSGGVLHEAPTNCFERFSCFFRSPSTVTDAERPDIITMSTGMEASNLEGARPHPEDGACGGAAIKTMLDQRPSQGSLVASTGNNPWRINIFTFNCERHTLGVVGTDLRRPEQTSNSSTAWVDEGSSVPPFGASKGFVGVPMQAARLISLDGMYFEIAKGTSYGAPEIASIMATVVSVFPLDRSLKHPEPTTALDWFDLFKEFSKQTLRSKPKSAPVQDSTFPFVNGGCFFSHMMARYGIPKLNEGDGFKLNFDDKNPDGNLCEASSD